MKNQIQYIVDETMRESERELVILMTSTHPMTDNNLALTGHKLYNLELPQFPIKWDGPMPDNMTLINSLEELPHRPDVIISQNVVDQYPIFKQLGYQFDCPIIEFEHTVPSPDWLNTGVVEQIKNQVTPTTYVFITDYSRKEWKREEGNVLYHMVDTDFYNGWTGGNGRAAIMCNAFSSRKWAVGDIETLMIKDADERIDLFGHNPGYQSQPLPKKEVPGVLSQYEVFINTSLRSPIPASLLEAAAIGMPLLSTSTCAIPEFFVEGESIRFFNNDYECLEILTELLNDEEQRKRLGAAAREVVLQKFNKERYLLDWDYILTDTIERYHHA